MNKSNIFRTCLFMLIIFLPNNCYTHQFPWEYVDYEYYEIDQQSRLPKRLSPVEVMIDVTNDLSYKILDYHSISNRNNFAFSPAALVSVLIALYEGSEGQSMNEIHQFLQVPWNRDIVRIGYRDVHRKLTPYFFNQENPLNGLSFNIENVTITPAYESVLEFYGYNLGMDMISSENCTEATSTVMPTTTTDVVPSSSTTITTAAAASSPSSLSTIITEVPSTSMKIDSIKTTEIPSITKTTTASSLTKSTTTENGTLTSVETETTTILEVPSTKPSLLHTEQRIMMPSMKENLDSMNITTTIPNDMIDSIINETIPTASSDLLSTITTGKDIISTTIPSKDILSTEIPSMETIITEATSPITELDMETTANIPTDIPKTFDLDTRARTSRNARDKHDIRSKRHYPLSIPYFGNNLYPFAGQQPNPIQDFNYIDPNQQIYGPKTLLPPSNIPPPAQVTPSQENIINDLFYLNDKDAVQTTFKLYNALLNFKYIESIQASAIELELDSDDYSLLLFVPNYGFNLDYLTGSLKYAPKLRTLKKQMTKQWVKALIPDFFLKGNIFLTNDLQNLGVSSIFEPNKAEFKKMTTENVYVKHIEQMIDVNIRTHPVEQLIPTLLRQYKPIEMFVNRPFLFFIMDKELDVAIMAGRVLNPLNIRIQ